MSSRAFTLLELCVALVILSTLALIAVPHMQLAGTRAKISRVHADFSTIATALGTYHVDNGRYPESNESGTTPTVLSTPIAYLASSRLEDPFYKKQIHGPVMDDNQWLRYNSWVTDLTDDPTSNFHLQRYGAYWMYSNPPFEGAPRLIVTHDPLVTTLVPYDTTNGTVSAGRIIRGAL